MDTFVRGTLWNQFGAAIDTLDAVILACPETLWENGDEEPRFWYLAYHTIFWLDFYLEGGGEGYAPPAPFGLEELDPSGLIPEKPATKVQLHDWLKQCRTKCRRIMSDLDDSAAQRLVHFPSSEMSYLELSLYNMRHVQHHAAQLNLILREKTGSATRWVKRAKPDTTS
jgi:hypothetical protein